MRILHLLDSTTPPDAFDLLAHLLPHYPFTHVAALGHRNSQLLATQAGMNANIDFLPSIGWADPSSLRPLHRLVKEFQPTHLHAWGTHALLAASIVPFCAHRLATFTTSPTRTQLRLLTMVTLHTEWTWTTPSATVEHSLQIENPKSKIIRLPLPLPPSLSSPRRPAHVLREELELEPADGPLLLLAGDGPSARHDFGLWAAAIVSQLFPNTRALLREDPRGREDPGLNRFLSNLPNDRLIALAPADTPWTDLLAVADILLLTPGPGQPTSAGPLLHALAGGVPVLATPVHCVTEIVTDNVNGLLSHAPTPRSLAARLEEFMTVPTLRATIQQGARTWSAARPSSIQLVEAMTSIYEATSTSIPANACAD